MRKMHKRYLQDAQMLCSKCTNVMLKIHERFAQDTQMICAKCTNVMLKIHKTHPQCAETLCSKSGNVTLKMHKNHVQNAETSCSNCRNIMHKASRSVVLVYMQFCHTDLCSQLLVSEGANQNCYWDHAAMMTHLHFEYSVSAFWA